MKHLIFIALLTVLTATGLSQPKKIAFETYNVAEGLPEETVSSIIQDDKGFIWASTQNGLVKYDGYEFKVYQLSSDSSQNTKLQIKNLIGGLLKAHDGKIWMGGGGFTDGGTIASFDPVSEQFKHYYLPEFLYGSKTGSSYTLFEDSMNNFWFGNLTDFTGIAPVAYSGRINPSDGNIIIYPDPVMLETIALPIISNIAASAGTVWYLDIQSNLKKWNPETDIFETVITRGSALKPNGKSDTIRWLIEGRGNRLFLKGGHIVYVYDTQKQQVIKSFESASDHEPGTVSGDILAAKEDKEGYYWLMHSGGILTRIHPDSGNIQKYAFGNGELSFSGAPKVITSAFFLIHQNEDGLWFETFENSTGSTYFLYFDFATQNFNFYNNDFNVAGNGLPSRFFSFMEDRIGLLWLYTRPGMYKQSPKKRQMELYRYNPNDSGSIPSDTINCLFEDSKSRLWIGTPRGLALYRPKSDNFLVFRHDHTQAATISHNNITAIEEDADGKIWVGTENGLNQWQESTGTFKRLFSHQADANYCLALFSDKQHRLWVSVRNKGVFVLDKSTGMVLKSYTPDKSKPAAITHTLINTIYQDHTGNIWLGSNYTTTSPAGLFRLNSEEDGFFHYIPDPRNRHTISNRRTMFIDEDGKNRLWIGTDSGLNLYNPDNDNFTKFHDHRISSVTCCYIDKNGEPWFGTYSTGGLVFVDLENNTITSYGEAEGLLHSDISISQSKRIVCDDSGRFWLPTQRGLSVFDPESKTFVSYLEKDGFQPFGRRYNTLKTSNGDVWIGGRKGLNRIIPSELLKKDTSQPAIAIRQITINNTDYSIPDGKIFTNSVSYTDEFRLRYWQKDISFGFVALHFLRPEDNLYSWKLENYDKEWSVPSKDRKAFYTNLSPGDYVFRVKASNADGVWNEDGVSIALTILPPWWLTWWAYVIYILLFVAAIRSYSLWRLRHLRLEKEHLQAKVEERTCELKKSLEEIKATQAQLIHSEKLASLGALTAGIAHEIQNPLNLVNNYSEISNELILELKNNKAKASLNYEIEPANQERDALLENEILNDISNNLEKILHHGKRADSIVKGMLQHSRSGSGVKEPTNINNLAGEYLRLAYHGMRAKDKTFTAEFKTETDPNLPNISVVPQDIGRVLLNLINNAFYAVDQRKRDLTGFENLSGLKTTSDQINLTGFKNLSGLEATSDQTTPLTGFKTLSGVEATPDQKERSTVEAKTRHALSPYIPTVTVSTRKNGNGIEISVKDNGPGIPEEIRAKIFQPFFTTKPTGEGTGLGLSLAYDIVKAHGGEITIESIEGEGTEFIITLPCS